jgi:adenylylsulfate kinase
MQLNKIFNRTIFITGITASGKSTLGKRLNDELINYGIDNVKFLDGEDLRISIKKLEKEYGYSNYDREKMCLKTAGIALEYNRNGYICIISSICHIKKTREKMKKIIGIGDVLEVFLDCPVSICSKRDYKNHYVKAFQGEYDNFIGVTEPYQESNNIPLILYTGKDSIDNCSRKLFDVSLSFLQIIHK